MCSQTLWWTRLAVALAIAGALTTTQGCVKTPYTGRQALILLPWSQEKALGAQSYQEILSKETLCTDATANKTLTAIGQRIAKVSGKPGWAWQFKVIAAKDTPNAFALPGGKVAAYSGIYGPAKNEAGLATVIAHEVGHAIARHGGQRITQSMLVGLGLEAADLTLGDTKHKDKILAGLGVGAQVGVLLPYSRSMEEEADTIGIYLMAQAGYDPREAVAFWKRFQKAKSSSGGTPEFLSTHPATKKRIANLEKLVPKALELYQKAPTKLGAGKALAVPKC